MKFLQMIRNATAALVFLLPIAAKAQMVPSNDRVRVQVQVDTQSDHKDIARSSVDTVTQYKTLKLQLSGRSRNPETRVIKWKAYGRDMKSNDQRVIDSGEIKLELSPNGQQAVESKRITTTYTPEHYQASRSRGRSLGRATRVDGSGAKYIGYSVQILDGGRIVGEISDPAGIAAKN